MRYTVSFTPKADRMYAKLPDEVQRRLKPKIDALAEHPRPPGVKKLAGDDDLYRIRAGDYRVVYSIQDKELLVLVVAVGQRGGIYREV